MKTRWVMTLLGLSVLTSGSADAAPAGEPRQLGASCVERGDVVAAIAAFTDAIRLNPKDAKAYCARGLAYGAKREVDKALADETEAIRIDPSKSDAHYRLGRLWDSLGRNEAAQAEFVAGDGRRLREVRHVDQAKPGEPRAQS